MMRLLHVTIFEGTELVEHKAPYVVAELLDITGRPIKSERAKTHTATYGPTVTWANENPPSIISCSSAGGGAEEGATAAGRTALDDVTKEDDDLEGVTLTLGRRHDLRNVGALPVLRLSVWGRETISKHKPLGVGLVDLADLPMDGTAVTSWRSLEAAMGMDRSISCGRLRVSIQLDAAKSNRIFSAIAAAAAGGGGGPEDGEEGYQIGVEDGPGYEDEECKGLEPNLLVVKVRQARGLPGLDAALVGESLSDPYVRLICDGEEHKTKVVEKNLSPIWNETFEFPVKDFTRRLDVTVIDWDLIAADKIGGFGIMLGDLVHKKRVRRWYRLLDADELHDPENPLGELEMSVQWIHDPRMKDLPSKRLTLLEMVQRTLGLYEFSSDTNEDEDEDEDEVKRKKNKGKGKNLFKKAVDKEMEKKKLADKDKEKKALRDELMDIKIKSGDYTIYVHIIEARDLKAEDLQGTSDPVVYVEAFGQRHASEVKDSCLSCVFDETFVIGLRNLDKDEFEEGTIRVSVMDADGPMAIKNDLIGAYSFDAANVYFHKDHEIHRQWVALVDDENPRDPGTQGFLQLSIAIVGPGDKLKVHDEAEDRRKEREAEAKAGGIAGMLMVPPSVSSKLQWLVTTVWRAEYLPVMDIGTMGYRGGDYYTTVSVSGGAQAMTKSKTMFGSRSAMCPVWRTQLWVPVSLPSMAGSIKTIIKDWDALRTDEVVACLTAKLKEIENLPDRRHKPRWFPLYGVPIDIPKRKELSELGKIMTSDMTDWRVMYENLPQKASTYRGRILLSREIRDELPKGRTESTPWRRKVSRLSRKKEPATSHFAMRCYVAAGADIPQTASVVRMGHNFRISVRIGVGPYVLETTAVENEDGNCHWGELLESKEPMVLPSDSSQMPDVLVHIQRGEDKVPLCFHRFPLKDLLGEGMNGISPRWLLLQEDKVLNRLPSGQYPGSVLIKLAVGSLDEFSDTAAEWQAEALKLRDRTPYLLRVHVYQARDLPASDANGLMDPYLKLQCQGQMLNTETFMYLGKPVHRRRETVDPMWYFTWEADLSLPPEELHEYFPQVLIQLMDYDRLDADDYAGCLFLNLGSCPIDREQNNIPYPSMPTWMPFFLEKEGDSSGELLLSCQLIKTSRAGLIVAPPPDLSPKLRPAYLEVLALGVRGMQPFEMMPIQSPYMKIEADLPHNRKISLTTNPSKKPSGADANFLERITEKVQLPVEEIFAPRLKLRVYDVRLGGFLTPVVGVGAVSLDTKLPWSTKYVMHSAPRYMTSMAIMRKTGAPVFNSMFLQGQGVEEDARSHVSSIVERRVKSTPAPLGGVTDVFGALDAGDAGSGDDAANDTVHHAAMNTAKVAPDPATRGAYSKSEPALKRGAAAITQEMGILSEQARKASSDAATREGEGGGGEGERKEGGPKEDLVGEKAPEKDIVEVMGQEDQGAGVFGAILHEPVVREKIWAAARAAKAGEGDAEVEEEEGPPKYMINRGKCDAELERELEISPFETYELFRGQQKFGDEGGEGDYRVVGKFKCIIRVTLGHPDDEPFFAPHDKKRNEEILNTLLLPKGYKMRLYVLQALNLTPMDLGLGGRPGKSDPYLKVKLGKESFNDSENYIDDVTDADIYKCVEINCELPGASQLQVAVMDYDDIGSDELIGRTVIDLEDRWFSQEWQAIGMENRVEDLTHPDKMRWQTKPIENRSLYVPTSNAPQGILQCWVDIMPPGDAKAFPTDDISLPPALTFEVRLVIWKCKDVVSMDWASGKNDLYVKAWIEGSEPQTTDTHWRASGGKGSFNWRIKFQVELGPRTHASKFPYLTLQMWDKDLLKWSDCIAETMLDLGKYFRRAYKKKTEVLKLFESVRTERAKETLTKTQQALASEQAKALEEELKTGIFNPLLGDPAETHPYASGSDDDSMYGDAEVGLPSARRHPGGKVPEDPKEPGCFGEGGCCGCLCFCFRCNGKKTMSPLELREENDRRRTLGMPLLDEEEAMTRKEARKKRKEEGDEEVQELIQKVKAMIGMSSDDPPDSQWIKMEKIDRKKGRKKPMGQCLIGIQIFPVEKAEAQPVGTGRKEPNDSPYLPPPTGRLKFMWNPISMIYQLVGPKMCAVLCCILCCVIFVLTVLFLQPLWTFLITLAFSIGNKL